MIPDVIFARIQVGSSMCVVPIYIYANFQWADVILKGVDSTRRVQ